MGHGPKHTMYLWGLSPHVSPKPAVPKNGLVAIETHKTNLITSGKTNLQICNNYFYFPRHTTNHVVPTSTNI